MGKKILVYAYYAANVGDDLFLKVLFDRYPHVSWDLLTANRNYELIFKDYPNVKITYTYREIKLGGRTHNLFFMLHDYFSKYKKYDAMIHIGGSIFMQGTGWKKKFLEREYLVDTFKKLDKKTFVLGANFGPYNDESFINKYRGLIGKYDDICFRDTYSYQLFEDLKNVRVAGDVVFNLRVSNKVNKNKCVGISTINLTNRKGLKEYADLYDDKMIELIEYYIASDYQVKMFSFCEVEGDSQHMESIKHRVKEEYQDKIKLIPYVDDLHSFLSKFQRCETIIGARFHSIILAILFNQSFFPIIYSDKTYHVLKDMNENTHSCYIGNLKDMDVQYIAENARQNKEKKQLYNDSQEQFEKLDDFLNTSLKRKELIKDKKELGVTIK